MTRVTFNSVPGCKGEVISNLLLKISAPSIEHLKAMLTLTNKSVQWQIKSAQSTIGYLNGKLNGLEAMNTPKDSALFRDTIAKIDEAKQTIVSLKDDLIEEYYEDNHDGTLTVPAGFWWLCESVRSNGHQNSTLGGFYLKGLRPYQIEALDALYKHHRGTVELATGLGKSMLIMSAALAGVKSSKRVMIVVPTEYLVGQMYKELKDHHENVTAIGGDYKHPKLGWDVMVVTINSAAKYIDEAEMLLLDECHHAAASTWFNLCTNAVNATHVYNFTATAFRADGLDLAIHAFGGPIVYARGVRWGIENRWLSPVKIIQVRIAPRKNDGSKWNVSDYTMATKAYKILCSAPNIMNFLQQKLITGLSKGRRIMCIFRTVKMGVAFKKHCNGGDLKFNVASADKKVSKDPKAPLRHFCDGKTDLLVACDKLVSEGINIPGSDMLVLMTQNSSDITTFQLIGRVLRMSEGKTNAVVLDISVTGYAQFERAADKRLGVYRQITDDVSVVRV